MENENKNLTIEKEVFKYGLGQYWIELVKVKIIKETPKKIKVLKIQEHYKNEHFYSKEFFYENFFNTRQQAREHIFNVIEKRKEIILKRYNESFEHLDKKQQQFKN